MPIKTECDYPFATSSQASAAITTLLEVLTSDPNDHVHEAECILRCCVALASYSASQLLTPVAKEDKAIAASAVSAMSDGQKAAKLKECKTLLDGTGPKAAAAVSIPWLMILELAYSILRDWLQPPPVG